MPSGTVIVDAAGQHAGSIQVAPQSGQIAALNISGGWIEVADTVAIATAGTDGQVNLSGGKLRTGSLTKGAGGSFNFTGGTLAADVVDLDLVNDVGTISPGGSPGVTQVLGDLTINSGSLAIELGGTTAGTEFDQLLVSGNATLGGTLDISLLSGFILSPSTSFEILDITGSRTGTFTDLSEGSSVGKFGLDLFITYTAGDGNDVALYTTSAAAGDFNHDGDVDGADFLAWQRNPSVGNLADRQANYGTLAAASAVAAPEPLTNTLALIGLLRLLSFRQRKIQ